MMYHYSRSDLNFPYTLPSTGCIVILEMDCGEDDIPNTRIPFHIGDAKREMLKL